MFEKNTFPSFFTAILLLTSSVPLLLLFKFCQLLSIALLLLIVLWASVRRWRRPPGFWLQLLHRRQPLLGLVSRSRRETSNPPIPTLQSHHPTLTRHVSAILQKQSNPCKMFANRLRRFHLHIVRQLRDKVAGPEELHAGQFAGRALERSRLCWASHLLRCWVSLLRDDDTKML